MTKQMENPALRKMPFRKMHGLGNDFVIFDGRSDPLDLTGAQVRLIASRNRGIGCDQIITLLPSERADVYMKIHNADGSEVNACGNATRCVGDILMGESGGDQVTIETAAGRLTAHRDQGMIRVDMGVPRLDWQQIPLAQEMDTANLDLAVGPLKNPLAVNMGNPHVVFFVEDVAKIPLQELGPEIEHHALFPERVNVSIVEDRGNGRLRHRVWERGAGITEACGSAACAVVVAATLRGIVDRRAEVELDGGILHMAWDDHNHVQMTGPVAYVFAGEIFEGEISL